MLTAHTIKEISTEMERKGIEFYQGMKDGINDSIYDEIIEDEKRHIRIFNDLFRDDPGKYSSAVYPDFYMDEDMLISAYANTALFGNAIRHTDHFKGMEPYDIAINLEKESILFYSQLEEYFRGSSDFPQEIELLQKLKHEEGIHLSKFLELKKNYCKI